jgi:hypothetical protein
LTIYSRLLNRRRFLRMRALLVDDAPKRREP